MVAPLVIADLTLVGVYYMQGVSGSPFTNVFATSLRNGASAAWPPTMNGSFGSNSPIRSRSRKRPESAHPARCGSLQRRCVDRTDSRRSGLSVGTGQSARQGCDRSKPPTNRDTERPAQCRPRAEPKQEAGRLTGRPSASSDYPIECARRCSALGVTSLRRRDLARRGAIQISR